MVELNRGLSVSAATDNIGGFHRAPMRMPPVSPAPVAPPFLNLSFIHLSLFAKVPAMHEFDVLVVGKGNAAMCAALSAHDQGVKVAILEAATEDEGGGN